jgi:hypothetical protein
VLDLFAYEREADQSLVVAAGVPPEWLDGSGISVKGLRTPYGLVSYSARNERGRLVLQLDGSRVPPGGVVFVWPGPQAPPRDININGKPAQWDGTELRVRELPARVVIK